jgi:hypothetical protein
MEQRNVPIGLSLRFLMGSSVVDIISKPSDVETASSFVGDLSSIPERSLHLGLVSTSGGEGVELR